MIRYMGRADEKVKGGGRSELGDLLGQMRLQSQLQTKADIDLAFIFIFSSFNFFHKQGDQDQRNSLRLENQDQYAL